MRTCGSDCSDRELLLCTRVLPQMLAAPKATIAFAALLVQNRRVARTAEPYRSCCVSGPSRGELTSSCLHPDDRSEIAVLNESDHVFNFRFSHLLRAKNLFEQERQRVLTFIARLAHPRPTPRTSIGSLDKLAGGTQQTAPATLNLDCQPPAANLTTTSNLSRNPAPYSTIHVRYRFHGLLLTIQPSLWGRRSCCRLSLSSQASKQAWLRRLRTGTTTRIFRAILLSARVLARDQRLSRVGGVSARGARAMLRMRTGRCY